MNIAFCLHLFSGKTQTSSPLFRALIGDNQSCLCLPKRSQWIARYESIIKDPGMNQKGLVLNLPVHSHSQSRISVEEIRRNPPCGMMGVFLPTLYTCDPSTNSNQRCLIFKSTNLNGISEPSTAVDSHPAVCPPAGSCLPRVPRGTALRTYAGDFLVAWVGVPWGVVAGGLRPILTPRMVMTLW